VDIVSNRERIRIRILSLQSLDIDVKIYRLANNLVYSGWSGLSRNGGREEYLMYQYDALFY